MVWQNFMSNDLELLESGLLADATITCGDRTWKVHKSIIYRCEWFRKAFNGNFEEAQTNCVNISAEDFSPQLVEFVISFIYSGVVTDIEKLNTNDSLVDSCVRLWVIADFFVLKELQKEAINILEKYCDEKTKVLCVLGGDEDDHKLAIPKQEFQVLLDKAFRGVDTSFTQYPHSLPCQQVLIGFFHAIRIAVFGTSTFSNAMSTAPRQFSHELFMATLQGRENKWGIFDRSEYNLIGWKGQCKHCRSPMGNFPARWEVDIPSSSVYMDEIQIRVPWHHVSCFKNGFETPPTD